VDKRHVRPFATFGCSAKFGRYRGTADINQAALIQRRCRYIGDFVCREKNLIIEVDGGQHADNPPDVVRDNYLAAEGYSVPRFWNNDVLTNPDGVLLRILDALK